MSLAEISLAILVLLVTPGPTNTLLFIAGSERGAGRALRLIPAELAGYLAAVVPLMLVGAALIAWVPYARQGIMLVASLWVAVLAVRLFRLPRIGVAQAAINARAVFVTTLLNPKALIFGLVLLPGPTAAINLLIFVSLVILIAAGWATAGAAVMRSTGTAIPVLRRVAAVWLAVVSASLLLRGLVA